MYLAPFCYLFLKKVIFDKYHFFFLVIYKLIKLILLKRFHHHLRHIFSMQYMMVFFNYVTKKQNINVTASSKKK